ncbi:MAG: archaeosortase/exosortase family protein [Kiritimatiellia bacterium]|nr:archaeosortase/exosortase family protein [Kiritimatiellia bacterium]
MTQDYRATRSLVATAAGLLLGLWVFTHIGQLLAAPDTLIRFLLTGVFALLVILRPKPEEPASPLPTWLILVGGLCGVTLHIVGIVFGIHQGEWLGLLIVVAVCLGRALPGHYARDAAKALFLVYWAHPLPSQVLGAFQITMQQISVTGSEWLLHIFNVRVWADGLVLKTGLHIFEVPAWCSGMRTATTVFILALGLGLIKRLALHQKILAVAAALLQAVALNTLRITAMVFIVPRLPNMDSLEFLHDTAGVIVIAAVFLVYLEIEFMRHAKRKADHLASELTPELGTILREPPPFWRRLVDHPGRILAGMMVLFVALVAGFKLRPYHRAEMHRGVTEAMRDAGQLADAERLGWKVAAMNPDDDAWASTMLRLLVMRGKYQEALNRLERFPPTDGERNIEHLVLKAYSLMGLDRSADARVIIDEMPEDVRENDPRVAMILAEMAFHANNPDEVARRVITAAQWEPNIGRIRALYPYLRLVRKWDVISDTDPRTAYRDPVQALSAAEAFMNLNRVFDVATLANRATADWPRDPRLLVPLFYLTGKRPDEGWEQRYAEHLHRCLPTTEDTDALYSLVADSFQIRRPDLAWAIYKRIQTIAPDYPGLAMIAVRYGHRWFSFRRRALGLPSGGAWDAVTLKPYFHVGRLTPIWAPVCDAIPLGPELSVSDTVPTRKTILKRALNQFKALDASDLLSLGMRYEYAFALEIDKDLDGARAVLARIAQTHPAEAETARIELSAIYERNGDWQNVYEALRTYPDDANPPRLTAMTRLTTAQLNLKLGLGALHTARETVRHFPQSGQASGLLSLALGKYDSPEASLAALSRDVLFRAPDLEMFEADALLRTQRFTEYRRLKKDALLGVPPVPPDAVQGYALPSAVLALNWHLLFIPSEQAFANYAAQARQNLPKTTSPFLLDLYTLWLAAYESDQPGPLLRLERWQACGRDDSERAAALSQLCLLLCRSQNYKAARAAAEAATVAQPQTALHWRFLVGLSGGAPDVIARARAHCPADSELWLAWLFSLAREGLDNPDDPPERPQLITAIQTAISADAFPPATLTRAAELLLRTGYRGGAILAARKATDDARSLLPAYIIGLRCAILAGDLTWAEFCTTRALRSALQPPPDLYKKLVELKMDDGELDLDDDMVEALKNLRRSDPDNSLWPRMLAFVRFKRGGWEVLDSLNQATAALEAGATDRMTYIIGAEAARLLRNPGRAADLLRQGLQRYPGNAAMLNNLAYTLAEAPGRAATALEIIPELLERTTDSPWLIDTIALVYLRNDRLKEAEQALGWLSAEPPAGSPEAFRTQLRRAEIAFRRDELQETINILRAILKGSKGISDEDILNANRLLSKADETLRQLGQRPSSASDAPTATSPPTR